MLNAVLKFGGEKPDKIALRNLIFLLKPGTQKTCIKAYRPISLISSLLKLASRILAKKIEHALIRRGLVPRTLFAYLKGKSTQDLIRSIRDIIDNS